MIIPTALFVLAVVGAALVLDDVAWFRRRPLHLRLSPYLAGGAPNTPDGSLMDVAITLFGPSLRRAGDRVSAALGVNEALHVRLALAGSAVDEPTFRMRQALHAVVATATAGALAVVAPLPLALGIAALIAAPLIAILIDEQRLVRAAQQRETQLASELPVIVEQLALLLGAGYSVPGALGRISERGNGIAAAELAAVGRRIRSGQGDAEALQEWARYSGVVGVRRLVDVLGLHREAGDLGGLLDGEARALRAEAHRDLLETIERRAQMVWIPVTVATLVPGLIFLAVPFMSAMNRVTGG